MARASAFLTFAFCLLPSALILSSPQTRDTTVPETTGTGIIAGTVMTDDGDHKPVRRATVTLGGTEANNLRAGQSPRQTMTDDQGRFLFSSLPSGTFSVTATKPGFLTGYYGSKRAGRGPSAPVILAAAQRVTDVAIAMVHGASITGVIVDQNGRPQPDVRVSVYESRMQNGERTLVNTGSSGGISDDRGVYRLWGLASGTFVVSATPQQVSSNAVTRLIGADEMQWAAQLLRSAPAPSSPSAGSPPASAATTGPPAPSPGRAVTYAPVFYPGTTDPASATAVTVGAGEERASVNFSLPLVSTSRIEGQVVGPDGQPMFQGVQLTMTMIEAVTVSGNMSLARPSPPDRTGKFTIPVVPPGTYRLMARVQGRGSAPVGMPMPPPPPPPPPPPMGGGNMLQLIPPPPSAAPTQDLWASLDLTVDGQDLSDLVLSLRPGMTVSGRVVFEATTLTPPTELNRVRISLAPVSGNGSVTAPPAAMAKADMTFQVSGAIPAKYRLSGSAPSPPTANGTGPFWTLKSAMLNGRDVLDSSLEIRPDEPVQGLVVTYTDRSTELSGALVDAAGKPASGYVVLVITTDRSLWPAASRRIRLVRPTFDGKYRTTGLPPGEYAIGAIVDLDAPDMGDTAFLEQVVAASLKFTLGEGEKKTQDLKLRGGG
jgi:hypothetical protein